MTEQVANIVAVAIVFLGTFIKIPKLEVNVWGLIGKGITKDINAKLDAIMAQQKETSDRLEKHIANDDERYAINCRTRILQFNDEILHKRKHTKEHFDQALSDITDYNNYCDTTVTSKTRSPSTQLRISCRRMTSAWKRVASCEQESEENAYP